MEGQVAAADRRRARAAVGLEDVAVDDDLPLAEQRRSRTTARRARPMRRWISMVRPLCLPRTASRSTRSGDEPGSIEYSAVTQPRPLPFIQRGTSSSTTGRAQHAGARRRRRAPNRRPASVKSRSKLMGRSSSGWRPSGRVMVLLRSRRRAAGRRVRRRRRSAWSSGGASRASSGRRGPARDRAAAGPGRRTRPRRPRTGTGGRPAGRRRAPAAARRRSSSPPQRERGLVGRADSTTSGPITSEMTRARYG